MAKSSKKTSFDGSERIAVLHGSELFLQREQLALLRAALAEAHDEVDTLRFDGRHATLAEVLDEVRSFGLMQQYKLVVIEDADQLITKHREALERYAADPVDIATLLLRPTTWNSSWKLHKAIGKIGSVIKCEPMDEQSAQAWIVRQARDVYDAKMAARAAALLVEHLGTDLSSLDNELAKLSISAGKGGAITVDQIEELVGFASDEVAWEIQEAMLSGDADQILGTLGRLIHLSRQAEQLVGYFMADLVRKVCLASGMMSTGMGRFEICKQLKIWPQERQAAFLDASGRIGGANAARLLAMVVEIDRRSKSGYVKSGENLRGLERFGVQFAEALG
jgi:DNA polymerase-3 subunit delta